MIAVDLKSELAQLCGIDPERIKDDRLLVEYGMDSVRILEMCCVIEDHYDIFIDDQEILPLRTLNDVTKLIQSKILDA